MSNNLVSKKERMEKTLAELEVRISKKKAELASLLNTGSTGETLAGEFREVQSKEIIIRTMNGDNFRGKINIGWEERLSDMFTKIEIPFIILYEASYKGEKDKTFIINKQNIVYIEPVAE